MVHRTQTAVTLCRQAPTPQHTFLLSMPRLTAVLDAANNDVHSGSICLLLHCAVYDPQRTLNLN